MGVWSGTLERARVQANAGPPAHDNFWYQPIGGTVSMSGERVNDETSLKHAMVYACARVLWETVGSLPWITYRRLPGGGKDRATDHPHYRLLHDAPNDDQTSMEFRETLMRWLLFQGNEIGLVEWAGGARGIEAKAIEPLEMSRVDIELVHSGTRTRRRYWYRRPGDSQREELNPADVIHFKGMGKNQWIGDSVLGYAAETIGLAQAYQRSGARWMKRGLNPSLALTHPKVMSETAVKNFTTSVESLYSGADNAGRVIVLEEDMKPVTITMKPADLQFLESQVNNSRDIQRYFRMQPHKVQDLERSTNNNIEHQGLEFATDTMRPWLVRIEQRMNAALFRDDPEYFCEILADGLYRGDLTARSNYHSKAIGFGWETPNEARAMENMNPIEGGDELRPTQGDQGAGQAPGVDQRTGRASLRAASESGTRERAIVRGVAERSLKREREGIRRAAVKSGNDEAAFEAAVAEFYDGHAVYLVDALALSERAARGFCARRRAEIAGEGVRVAEAWTVDDVMDLVEVGDV